MNGFKRGTMNYYIKQVLDDIAFDLNNERLVKDLKETVKNDELPDVLYVYFENYLETCDDYITYFLLAEIGTIDDIVKSLEIFGYDTSIDLMHHMLHTEFFEKISSYGLLDMLCEYDCKLNTEIIEILNAEYNY